MKIGEKLTKAEHIDCKTCGGRVKVRRKVSRDGNELIATCHGYWFVVVLDAKPTAIETLEFLIKAANMPKDVRTTNDHHPKTPEQIEADARVEAIIKPVECDA